MWLCVAAAAVVEDGQDALVPSGVVGHGADRLMYHGVAGLLGLKGVELAPRALAVAADECKARVCWLYIVAKEKESLLGCLTRALQYEPHDGAVWQHTNECMYLRAVE